MKMKVKKGDEVWVMAGKDNGQKGKIIDVQPERARVKVEKRNMMKRHTRPTQANPMGGILEKEAWIDASNVMIVDPKDGKPTRVGRKLIEVAGKKKTKLVRFAKRSGSVLD